MNVEPFKYLIQPVALERDTETGRARREVPGEVLTVYNVEDATKAMIDFEAMLARMVEQVRNGDEAQEDD